MPHIPEDVIEQIRMRADIVDIVGGFMQLRKRGDDYWGCCPFHKEKTPSFKVNVQRQAFYCFGCKKSGNVFHFIQEQENTDFVGAVHWLAHRVGVRIPEPAAGEGQADSGKAGTQRRAEREAGFRLLEKTAQWYAAQLNSPEAQGAREYLAQRGLDSQTIAAFGLGYAPNAWSATLTWAEREGFERDLVVKTGLAVQRDEQPGRCYDRFRGRLMFPIRDDVGRVVGFSGRILEADAQAAKYVNSPETEFFQKSRILYGLHLARQAFKEHGGALVCEGQLDVIACHRAGLTHAVSAQGTAFTEFHGRLLARSTNTVTLAFDADPAGEKAAVRTIDILHQAGMTVHIVALPEGEDPDSVFRKGGGQALAGLLAEGRDAIPFVYDLACRQYDVSLPNGKAAAVQDVLTTVKVLPDPVVRAAHCQWLSQQLGLPEQAVHDALGGMLRDQRATQARQQARQQAPAKAPGPRQAPMPPFSMPSATDQTLGMLLELALTIEAAARDMHRLLDADLVPDTPMGQALNMVIAHAGEGEWQLAAGEIAAHQELAADAQVGRALAESHCEKLDPQKAPEKRREEVEARLKQAVQDCVNRLRIAKLDQQIRDTNQALAEANGDDARSLQQQAVTLLNEKRQLQQPH